MATRRQAGPPSCGCDRRGYGAPCGSRRPGGWPNAPRAHARRAAVVGASFTMRSLWCSRTSHMHLAPFSARAPPPDCSAGVCDAASAAPAASHACGATVTEGCCRRRRRARRPLRLHPDFFVLPRGARAAAGLSRPRARRRRASCGRRPRRRLPPPPPPPPMPPPPPAPLPPSPMPCALEAEERRPYATALAEGADVDYSGFLEMDEFEDLRRGRRALRGSRSGAATAALKESGALFERLRGGACRRRRWNSRV